MKKDNKKYYIILGVLGVYFIILLIAFIIPSIKENNKDIYLLIDNYAKWKYVDSEWIDIKDDEEYNWKKFDIYENNLYIGKYYAFNVDRLRFYDKNDNPIKLDYPNFIAIKSNNKYKVANYEEKEIDNENMKYVNEVLKDNNISTTNFTNRTMFSYDLDNDKEEEKIFTITNVFTDEEINKIFNFIFMVKGDRITVVSKTIDDYTNMYDNCKLYVNKVIDVDNDSKYELITGCGYYSETKNCIEMYKLKRGKYTKIKSCE